MSGRLLLLASVLLPLPLGAADEDVVFLDNRQTLAGTVENDPAHPQSLVLKTSTGRLVIPRDRVERVEPGLSTRLRTLDHDDLAGLIDIGRQCRTRGRNAEALEALERAMALVRSDPKRLTDLAAAALYLRLVDEIRGPEAALPLYRWYRSLGGTDPATLARLQALEAIAGTVAGGADLPPLPAPARPDPAAAGGQLAEGLELRSWAGESAQWSNPVETKTVELTGKDALKGVRQALSVALTAPSKDERKDKATIRKTVNRSCEDTHVLGFRLKNTGENPLNIAIAVKTGDWVYYESQTQAVKPGEGWKDLRFDLKAKTFKSKASNWATNAAVEGLDDVKEFQVLFYNRNQDGSCLISSMKFLGDEEL